MDAIVAGIPTAVRYHRYLRIQKVWNNRIDLVEEATLIKRQHRHTIRRPAAALIL